MFIQRYTVFPVIIGEDSNGLKHEYIIDDNKTDKILGTYRNFSDAKQVAFYKNLKRLFIPIRW